MDYEHAEKLKQLGYAVAILDLNSYEITGRNIEGVKMDSVVFCEVSLRLTYLECGMIRIVNPQGKKFFYNSVDHFLSSWFGILVQEKIKEVWVEREIEPSIQASWHKIGNDCVVRDDF